MTTTTDASADYYGRIVYKQPRVYHKQPRAYHSKAPAIRAALQERYPCAVTPRGEQTVIAAEFGVTRERVRQIAATLGFKAEGVRRGHRDASGSLTDRACSSCGVGIRRGSKSLLCMACRWISVECSAPGCGKLVRRLAKQITNQISLNEQRAAAGKSLYTGRAFCNRTCFGRWAGAQNKGKTVASGRARASNQQGPSQRARILTFLQDYHMDEPVTAAELYASLQRFIPAWQVGAAVVAAALSSLARDGIVEARRPLVGKGRPAQYRVSLFEGGWAR